MGDSRSRQVGLFVLEGPGSGILFEKENEEGGYVPVTIEGSGRAARQWAEGNYQDVEWEGPDRARALIGQSSQRSTLPTRKGLPADHGPITFEEDGFRTRLPELVMGEEGLAILQTGEEYVAESGRWEPFSTTVWKAGW